MPNRSHPVQQLLIAMDVIPADGNLDHVTNNNNRDSLWHLRDRLFQVLFERASICYATACPEKLRRFFEIFVLFLAVACFCILSILHVTFVQTPVNCLEEVSRTWSREGVLRVEIIFDHSVHRAFNAEEYYNKTLAHYFHKMRQNVVNKQLKQDETKIDMNDLDSKISAFGGKNMSMELLAEGEFFPKMTVWPKEKYIMEYSLELGFLRLSLGARQNASIKTHTVILDPNHDRCFGNSVSRFILKNFVGYTNVLKNSFKCFAEEDLSKGYVRDVMTNEHFRFMYKNYTWTAYFPALTFMLLFTTFVSMLLRFSHHNIFIFVLEMLHLFEMPNVNFPLAPLATVVLALVGMEAIMSEFFCDTVTAFYIIIIIWIGDQYDAICCRSVVSRRHWIRLFYLYHFGFYAYHYRFGGQYSCLALLTSTLFIVHSMLYFYHRYELPSIWNAHQSDTDGYDSEASIPTVAAGDEDSDNPASSESPMTSSSDESVHAASTMENPRAEGLLSPVKDDGPQLRNSVRAEV